MPHVLGIDVSDTHVSAAVSRITGSGWSSPEIVRLDGHATSLPAVLQVSSNGSFTVGDPMHTQSTVDGDRVARGFVGRVGDGVPMVVSGEACLPQMLVAVLAMWVAERVLTQEQERTEHLVISHPPSWGHYRKQLVHQALWHIGLTEVTLLPQPITAAESHAWRGAEGDTWAIYALSGNGFASSVVRREPSGDFEVLASLSNSEPLGAEDFDEALARHLGQAMGSAQTPTGVSEDCAYTREMLTVAAEADILGVPVTRAEFEEMIHPALRQTVDCLMETVELAGLEPDQLDSILLVGGPARIPLVAELIAAQFPGLALLADDDPQVTAAVGAAVAACRIVSPPAAPDQDDVFAAATDGEAPALDDLPPRPPVRITTLKLPRRRSPARLAHARGFTFF